MSLLKDRVSGSVTFVRFVNTEAKHELWYRCDDGFEFPIPMSDTIGAEFGASDKGMYFMRWIRPHMKLIEESKN